MAETWLLPIIEGCIWVTIGAYLASSRTADRRLRALTVAVVAYGLGLMLSFAPGGQVVFSTRDAVFVVGRAAFLIFLLTFPARVRWRSATGAAAAVALVWLLASAAFVVAGGSIDYLGEIPFHARLLSPTALGATLSTMLVTLLRLRDLGATLDDTRRAARLMYASQFALTFGGAGFVTAQTLAGALGAAEYPSFLYTDAGVGYAVASALVWWGIVPLMAAFCYARWRWKLPAALFGIGAIAYLPILASPELDVIAATMVRNWASFLAPVFLLYALARYAPFPDLRTGNTAALLATAASALFTYLLAYTIVLVVVADPDLAYGIGPLIGVIAAAIVAALALPHARKLALRRIFAPDYGSAEPPLAPGRVLLGRYRIVRLLAEGGQGQVYEAVDKKRDGARVVLKAVTSLDAVREARILRGLLHENIIGLFEVVDAPGASVLVLEHAAGGDLRGLITRRGGKLPPGEALAIARGILAGLAAAHASGVTHRDLKPENVLLDARGTPMIADFGAAREASPGATVQVAGLGTLRYLAPEQLRGEAGDARTDVYSAGVVIHELLAGHLPISLPDDDFLARRAILTQPPRVAVPVEAAAIAPLLERALAKDPAARYADAREMLTALEGARAPTADST